MGLFCIDMAWIWTWCALACFTILLTPSYCVRRRNWFLGRQEKPSDTPAVPSYKINYFTQRLDHFNVADERTFQQRYLVNDEYWDKLGPILLYTGNEGEITLFWNNTVSGSYNEGGHVYISLQYSYCILQ